MKTKQRALTGALIKPAKTPDPTDVPTGAESRSDSLRNMPSTHLTGRRCLCQQKAERGWT